MPTGSPPERRLCPDQPDGIPHYIETPRAARCDQHRKQRDRWSDANSARKGKGQPLLEWAPEPLSPEHRRAALAEFESRNADDILHAVRRIRSVLDTMNQIRATMPVQSKNLYDEGVLRIRTQCEYLENTARSMGGRPTP